MATQDSAYLLGSTLREVERLQKQHSWIQTCSNGKIIFAPVNLDKPGLKILDVGCADGTLLRDVQKQVSSTAQLVGVDYTREFLPKAPQGNITYDFGDICEPPSEERSGVFDLTHVRYVLAAAAKVGIEAAVKNLAATVAPGGWVQLQELDVSRDHANHCTSYNNLCAVLGGMFDKLGIGAGFASKLDEALTSAGLVDVKVERKAVPAGRKLGDETAARNSTLPFEITIPSLRQAVKALGVELQPSVLDGLEERFEKEMKEEGANFTTVVAYGRKPL